MYLVPKEVVTDINPYYTEFHDFELIGYWQSSEPHYFSCGYVTPVFLGHAEKVCKTFDGKYREWSFDYEAPKSNKENKWILFFMGCDDGHTGLRFETKEAAIEWIKDCKIVDFKNFVYSDDYQGILCYHN